MNNSPPQIILKIIDQIRTGELSNQESLVLDEIEQNASNKVVGLIQLFYLVYQAPSSKESLCKHGLL